MSVGLHVRTTWLPAIEPDERSWWVEFLFTTGMFDTVDMAMILEIDEAEVCRLLHDAMEPEQ